MIPFYNDISRIRLTRLVFVWLFFVISYQWWADLMLSQLESPVLLRLDLDLTYWIIHLTGIGELIRSKLSCSTNF